MTERSALVPRGWADLLLAVIFALIVVISAFILLGAFSILLIGVISITHTQQLAITQLGNPQAADAKAYLLQLEALTRTGIDSGMMQFLFEVFSGAVIVVGVYLMARSHDNVRSMEHVATRMKPELEELERRAARVKPELEELERRAAADRSKIGDLTSELGIAEKRIAVAITEADRVPELVRRNTDAWSITVRLMEAHQQSLMIRFSPDGRDPAEAREALDELQRVLEKAGRDKIRLEPPQFDFSLDALKMTRSVLVSIPSRTKGISELIETCEKCQALLKDIEPQDANKV
jgi:hypothetical protein